MSIMTSVGTSLITLSPPERLSTMSLGVSLRPKPFPFTFFLPSLYTVTTGTSNVTGRTASSGRNSGYVSGRERKETDQRSCFAFFNQMTQNDALCGSVGEWNPLPVIKLRVPETLLVEGVSAVGMPYPLVVCLAASRVEPNLTKRPI